MDKYQKLERIKTLLENGSLSQAEYDAEKARILAEPDAAATAEKPWGMEHNTFHMLMHLSMLLGGLGFILLLVMWLTNKDKFPNVHLHGKTIMNWFISLVIYIFGFIIIAAILAMIYLPLAFIGWLGIVALAIASLIFTILGAVAANRGELYKYPLSLNLIK